MSASRPTLCMINFNGVHHLRASLTAAVGLTSQFREILLVDDASTDDSVSVVREEFPGVRLIELARNSGPAVARNAGYRAAGDGRVLFVDNDVLLTENCAPRLAAALDAHPNAAIAVPAILYAHDPEMVQYAGAQAHFLGMVAPEAAETSVRGLGMDPRPMGSLISACFLIDASRWGSEEPFDERFGIYQEDHDLGLRCRLRGLDLLIVPEARALHREGTAGLSLRATGEYTERRVYGTIRHRWQVIAKNYAGRTVILLAPSLLLYEVVQAVGSTVRGSGKVWWEALRWMWSHRTQLLDDRRRVQSGRRRSDGELLVGGSIPFSAPLARSRAERAALWTLDVVATLNWLLVKRWL
ncbi:MAG: glycosyltransferase family 2 protein [Gemmatimonadota bacterium]